MIQSKKCRCVIMTKLEEEMRIGERGGLPIEILWFRRTRRSRHNLRRSCKNQNEQSRGSR